MNELQKKLAKRREMNGEQSSEVQSTSEKSNTEGGSVRSNSTEKPTNTGKISSTFKSMTSFIKPIVPNSSNPSDVPKKTFGGSSSLASKIASNMNGANDNKNSNSSLPPVAKLAPGKISTFGMNINVAALNPNLPRPVILPKVEKNGEGKNESNSEVIAKNGELKHPTLARPKVETRLRRARSVDKAPLDENELEAIITKTLPSVNEEKDEEKENSEENKENNNENKENNDENRKEENEKENKEVVANEVKEILLLEEEKKEEEYVFVKEDDIVKLSESLQTSSVSISENLIEKKSFNNDNNNDNNSNIVNKIESFSNRAKDSFLNLENNNNNNNNNSEVIIAETQEINNLEKLTTTTTTTTERESFEMNEKNFLHLKAENSKVIAENEKLEKQLRSKDLLILSLEKEIKDLKDSLLSFR